MFTAWQSMSAMASAVEKKDLRVAPGEVFSISPGPEGIGGYVWKAKFNPSNIEEVARDEPATPEAVGGGVRHSYQFRMRQPGRAKVVFSLQRPWEKTAVRKLEYEISTGKK